MIEILDKIDIWKFHKKYPIVVTTNGFTKKTGECVMGRGIALEAKTKFPELSIKLGNNIKNFGNKVFYFSEYNLFTFPTKYNWWEKSDINLIEKSCKELVEFVDNNKIERIFLPRPGCGNGKLNWDDVKKILEKYLDNRFYIVNNN